MYDVFHSWSETVFITVDFLNEYEISIDIIYYLYKKKKLIVI